MKHSQTELRSEIKQRTIFSFLFFAPGGVRFKGQTNISILSCDFNLTYTRQPHCVKVLLCAFPSNGVTT